MDRKLWEKVVDFHGHECPGLAIGFKAAMAVIDSLEMKFSKDEEIVCITENDACGVDAIQLLTGCTFGKGNLIYKPTGKQAYSFFSRKTGENIRVVLKPILKNMSREEKIGYILDSRVKDLFMFKKPNCYLPREANIYETVYCEECNEGVSENMIKVKNGKKVCIDCYKGYNKVLQMCY